MTEKDVRLQLIMVYVFRQETPYTSTYIRSLRVCSCEPREMETASVICKKLSGQRQGAESWNVIQLKSNPAEALRANGSHFHLHLLHVRNGLTRYTHT